MKILQWAANNPAVVVSAISALIAGLSLFFTVRNNVRSAASGRTQAENARVSAEAAQRSAAAAEKSAEATTKGILDGQRAYLIPDAWNPGTMAHGPDLYVNVPVRVRNIGKTVAVNVVVHNNIQLFEGTNGLNPEPGEDLSSAPYLLPDGIITAPKVSLIVPSTEHFVLLNTVHIDFTDMFDDRWHTRWCYNIIWTGKNYVVEMEPDICIREIVS